MSIDAATAHARSRPVRRVFGLAALMSAATVGAFGALPGLSTSMRPSSWVTVVVIAIGFACAEIFAFHVEHDREAHSFSISDVPMALALVFVSPLVAVAMRIVVSAVVVAIRWRSPLFKQVFNASLFAIELGIAYQIVRGIAPVGQASDLRVLLGVGLGLVGANLVGSMLVSVAIASFEGSIRVRLVEEMRTSALVVAVATPIAVVCVAPVLNHEALLGLAFTIVAAAWATLERLGRLSQAHRDLEAAHGYADTVGRTVGLADLADDAIREFARLLRADRALIHVYGEDGDAIVTATVGIDGPVRSPGSAGADSTPRADIAEIDSVVDCVLDARGRPRFDVRDRPNALAVTIRDEDGVLGLVVIADRGGASPDFGEPERIRAEVLAGQLSANIRKALLLRHVEHTALHDALTGLPNRLALERALAERPRRSTGHRGVLMVGLNRVKEINDTLGHHLGDELLRRVTEWIGDQLRPTDLLARFSADEFAIVAERADANEIAELADRIRETSFVPIRLGDLDVVITASVGIASTHDADGDVAEVLRRADLAMFVARRDHTNIETYRPEIDRRAPERLSLLGSLRHALVNDGLEVHYQPKVDVLTSTVVGAEALIRWTHPTRGPISPFDFVQLAEESGMIGQLTDFVLAQAIRTERAWRDAGFDLSVSVNLSTHDLLDERLPQRIEDLLARWGTPADRLTLEITESALLADTPRTMSTIERIDRLGAKIALDDFGTGYSSLSYLRRLPVSELKVDQSFVKNLLLDEQDEVIVRSTIDLGHNLGLQVVAEGVENQPVLDRLLELGCDIGQGYGISRPLPADHFATWLRTTQFGLPGRTRPPMAAV